ncbi:MAG: FAD-binding oxidoreductase [Deltaproteobacteria bacterium]|jgi:D-lactate dehydrogenase (cytochrome)|nr:FAD-binding oxidoreductase [Deltaproteobacteria bacterium]
MIPKAIKPMGPSRQAWLHDETRAIGQAESWSMPEQFQEAAEILSYCAAEGLKVTFQGARTGLCGAATPISGHVLGLSAMSRPVSLKEGPDGSFLLKVRPGMSLEALNGALSRRRFEGFEESGPELKELEELFRRGPHFWPPNPGEASATLGGLASTNAQGPNFWRYGPAGRSVLAIELLTPDGALHQIERPRAAFKAGKLHLPGNKTLKLSPSDLGEGNKLELIDLILGSQGTLGLITALTLVLAPKPPSVWGLAFFFENEERAAAFVDSCLNEAEEKSGGRLAPMVSLDYLDSSSLGLVAHLKKTAAKLKAIAQPPAGAACAVLIELHGRDEGASEEAAGRLMELCAQAGGDPDRSWALTGEEAEKIQIFRHAVPEALGAIVDHLKAKGAPPFRIGLDASFPGLSFSAFVKSLRASLKKFGLEGALFGHAPQNRLHLTLIETQFQKIGLAFALFHTLYNNSEKSKGALFPEHGAGKFKTLEWLRLTRPEEVRARRLIKSALDPGLLLNPGNWPLDPPGEDSAEEGPL